MAQNAAKTGSGPTTIVAIEQHFPEAARVISDDLAYRILPFGMRAYVWLMRLSWARDWMVRAVEKKSPGVWAMSARPATTHLDTLRGFGGAEQLAEILKQHDTLAKQAKEWEKLAQLAGKRKPAWKTQTDALPQQFVRAVMAAAKLLAPKTQRVHLTSGTLTTEEDVKAWLAGTEKDLLAKRKDGPIVIS